MDPKGTVSKDDGGQTSQSASAASNASTLQQELTAVSQRDPRALATFFENHFPRIYNLAFRLMGEKTAAEDLTQEVFLRVYRAAHQIDTQRDPAPWLTTITLNVCRERWRSSSHKLASKSQSLDLRADLQESLSTQGIDPESVAIKAERETLLMNAIGKLPTDMRAVVILHDYQGYEHSTIATMTGENAATIRKRYSRALVKLREFLQDVL